MNVKKQLPDSAGPLRSMKLVLNCLTSVDKQNINNFIYTYFAAICLVLFLPNIISFTRIPFSNAISRPPFERCHFYL